MAVKQLSDKNTDGTVLGQSGDKISFFGVSAVTQQSVGSLVSAGATLTSIGSSVLAIQNLLTTYGLSS